MSNLTDNLKRLRTSRNMTQELIGKEINISARRYFSYESGESEPDMQTLVQLADFFDVSVDQLLNHTVPNSIGSEGYELTLDKFGERIRKVREEKNIDIKETAKRVGISKAYYSAIEKGLKTPKLETAIKIMNTLELSADYAFMDTVIASHGKRARFIESKLFYLRPRDQRVFLNVLESTLKSLLESYNEINSTK